MKHKLYIYGKWPTYARWYSKFILHAEITTTIDNGAWADALIEAAIEKEIGAPVKIKYRDDRKKINYGRGRNSMDRFAWVEMPEDKLSFFLLKWNN